MTDAQRIAELEAENRALLNGASNAARRIHILEKRVAELEAGLQPFADVPACGTYGGPLVMASIVYEDETAKRRGKYASLGHEPFRTARALINRDNTNG